MTKLKQFCSMNWQFFLCLLMNLLTFLDSTAGDLRALWNDFQKQILGHRFDTRYSWGEFYLGGRDFSLRLSIDGPFEKRYLIFSLPFLFKLYLSLGMCQDRSIYGDSKDYGFYFYQSEALVLCWGEKRKHINMPWTYEWESTEILDFGFRCVSREDRSSRRPGTQDAWEAEHALKLSVSKVYDYTYTLRCGEVQHRKATVTIIRRTWFMRCWPWKRFVRTDIDVTFDQGVGEQSGTWKGGVIATGHTMNPGETPEQCLRRMEQERKFN